MTLDADDMRRVDQHCDHFDARRGEMLGHLIERGLDDLNLAVAEVEPAEDLRETAPAEAPVASPKRARARARRQPVPVDVSAIAAAMVNAAAVQPASTPHVTDETIDSFLSEIALS